MFTFNQEVFEICCGCRRIAANKGKIASGSFKLAAAKTKKGAVSTAPVRGRGVDSFNCNVQINLSGIWRICLSYFQLAFPFYHSQ
jgi:hypothetical protein